MSFDGEVHLRILAEVLRLALQFSLVFGIDIILVSVEVDDRVLLSHRIDEMLLRTNTRTRGCRCRSRRSFCRRRRKFFRCFLLASGKRDGRCKHQAGGNTSIHRLSPFKQLG